MDNQLSTKKQAEIEQLPFLTTKNSRIKNLTGEQFGRLTVLGLAPKPNNAETRAYWWCICSCPQETIIRVSGKSLRTGNTKSCGCLQRQLAKKNTIIRNTTLYPGRGNKKDLTNMTFGSLIALNATEKRGNDHSIIWKCKCLYDNNTIFVPAHLLLNGSVQSCGCLKSKGERKISQILNNNNICYERQFSFKDLYDKNPTFPLKFDFAIFNQNKTKLLYLIEYDGIQHYEQTYYSHDTFLDRKRRDNLKDEYCKNHNIPLLRVPYVKYNTLSLQDLLLKENINDTN